MFHFEFRRFCKEKFIFTFNMVLTLFILLYVSLWKTSSPTKQTSNTLRMHMLVYYQFNTCSALYHHLLSQSHFSLLLLNQQYSLKCPPPPPPHPRVKHSLVATAAEYVFQGIGYQLWEIDRQTDRQRQRHRETECDRQRQRERQTDRDRKRQTETERPREIDRQRQRERDRQDRQRQRQTDRQTGAERKRQRQRERDRQDRQTDRERDRERQTETQRQRETDRQRQRETERKRQTDRQRQRHRENAERWMFYWLGLVPISVEVCTCQNILRWILLVYRYKHACILKAYGIHVHTVMSCGTFEW